MKNRQKKRPERQYIFKNFFIIILYFCTHEAEGEGVGWGRSTSFMWKGPGLREGNMEFLAGRRRSEQGKYVAGKQGGWGGGGLVSYRNGGAASPKGFFCVSPTPL